MRKGKFGVAVDKEIVQEVDGLLTESVDPGVNRFEIVEAIFTAFVQSGSSHAERVGNIIIQERELHSK